MRAFNDYRKVKARVPHECVWCHEAIVVGEKHTQFVGMWEGDFQDWRVHEECLGPLNDSCPQDGIDPDGHERPKKVNSMVGRNP